MVPGMTLYVFQVQRSNKHIHAYSALRLYQYGYWTR